ncbi:MAG TPA: chromate transporter [Symbiobacteriaceae bacterium]|jgi:chromate transporter|nr:chromate transporter [Symbiobacteriaceae bacterium]
MTVLKLFLLVVSLTAVSFGGGNTLLAGLERELVRPGFISTEQFAAAVALGQSTPGPLAAFTTAVGKCALGWPGAVAATSALIVISLGAVALIRLVPQAWFQTAAVRGALAVVPVYVVALVLLLAYRIVAETSFTLVGLAIMLAVVLGRLLKAPTAAVVIGAVLLGMAVNL